MTKNPWTFKLKYPTNSSLSATEPGIISFEKRGVLVKESAGVAILNVRRKFGADGEVSVKWRTINDSAIAGRDFVGGEGKLVFKHREILKTIEIPLIDDLRPEKDEVFVVELFSPSNNASLGNINKTCVTITNDDGKCKAFKVQVLPTYN